MNLKEFSRAFAKENHVTIQSATTYCEAVFDFLGKCFDTEDEVRIKGLGVFKSQTIPEHEVYSPYNGDRVMTPEKRVTKFKRVRKDEF